ncbi:hypothetical protein WN55_04796, partial [Dufourea novaeangliae]
GQTHSTQDGILIGSGKSLLPICRGNTRRTKSAFDLPSLLHTGKNTQENIGQSLSKTLKSGNEFTKLLHCDRRATICQSDRSDTIVPIFRDRGLSTSQKSWNRDRGMSICQFDRMDAFARPLQRDRGASVCHFDRTDVFASRPLQRNRAGSIYCFDRMDVLARPNFTVGKPALRDRRVSICNFLKKHGETGRSTQNDYGPSINDIDKIDQGQLAMEEIEKQRILAKCTLKEKKSTTYHLDQPSCSKTSDIVFGYQTTYV